MFYSAWVNSDSLRMFSKKNGEQYDAIAVIPNHLPDLEMLVAELPRDLAWQVARMADARAAGF
jgi:hypothetical protein